MATSLPPDAPRPRLCLIRKRTPEEEYGFNLHAEKMKGQFIGAVDAGSPAEAAGLRPGDRIVSVNGNMVFNESHKQVVAKIKENALSCDLIVVDEDALAWYTEHKIQVPIDTNFAVLATPVKKEESVEHTATPPAQRHTEYSAPSPSAQLPPPTYHEVVKKESIPSQLRPRLCKLIKADQSVEFGFNLHAEKNAGHFIGKIDSDSIAELAGLEEGQRIVGVNGVLIYPHTPHKDVVSLIKANPLRSELLVASPEVDAWYKKNAQEFDFAVVEHFVPMELVERGIVDRKALNATKTNGYTNGDSGISNGDHGEDSIIKETRSLHVEPSKGLNDQRLDERSPYSRPPPPIEPYDSIRENTPSYQSNAQQPDWMKLSAAQLRERVGQHKKPDPRKEQLSLQQKHELIRNM